MIITLIVKNPCIKKISGLVDFTLPKFNLKSPISQNYIHSTLTQKLNTP